MNRHGRSKPSRVSARAKAKKPSAARRSLAPEASPAPKPDAAAESVAPNETFDVEEERFFRAAEPFTEAIAADDQEPDRLGATLAPTSIDCTDPSPLDGHEGPHLGCDDPMLQARRRRLRRAVASTWCGSVALLLSGLALRQHDAFPAHSTAAFAVQPETAARTAPLAAPKALVEPRSQPVPEPLPGASASPRTDDSSSAPTASELIRTARALLSAGQIRAGVSVARQAVAANSSNAEPYILLAAGLQDLGDWSGAQSVFATCKQKTHRGPHADCSYFSSLTR